jgi:glutaminyl-peptide cyclotransferase
VKNANPVYEASSGARAARVGSTAAAPRRGTRRGSLIALSGALLLAFVGCERAASARPPSIPALPAPAATGTAALPVVRYGYDVVRAWPHDPAAFTQGLVFRNGSFLESTGLVGRSSLREVALPSGQVLKQVAIAPPYFAEGLAVIGDRAFQVTWQHHQGFVYDADTLRRTQEFTYEGEGWGLATDGQALILSDGTNRIRFLDPATFQVKRTIEVRVGDRPLRELNELEYIRGEIFANVWQTNEVARIDAATGAVRGLIDFAGLLPATERGPETDVLNGIAYDEAGDRLFITGKCWPKIFEVRLKVLPAAK